jgi:hypothetical protein
LYIHRQDKTGSRQVVSATSQTGTARQEEVKHTIAVFL